MRLEIASRCWKVLAAALVAGTMTLAASSTPRAQEVVEIVNDKPITTADIERRAKFLLTARKTEVSRDEALHSLTNDTLQIAEAKRRGLTVSDLEVDEAYRNVAARVGIAEQKLTALLVANGANADAMKQYLRAEIAWSKLVRGRFGTTLERRDTQ